MSLTPFLAAAAPLTAAAALVVLAAFASSTKVRALALLSAFVLFAASPDAVGAVGLTDGRSLAAASTGMAVAVAAAGLIAAVLAVLLAVERSGRTPAIAHGATPFQRAGKRRSVEVRAIRMRNLLKKGRQKLETVNEMHRFFELATRNSQITVCYQDTDLRYRWIVNPRLGFASEDVVGKTDAEVLPDDGQAIVIGHKRRAITTRATQTFEVELPEPEVGERS